MRKYYGIEILRFFTSLSVVLYHYRHFFSPYNSFSDIEYKLVSYELPFENILKFFYENGSIGVQVFYCISGFVFTYIYCHVHQNITAKKFFINRIARLYPLHFATLLLVLVLQLLSKNQLGNFLIYEFNDLYHFLLQVFFISSWGFEDGHSFNGPIWSVSVEIMIYILFFLFLSLIKKHKIFLLIFISIILLFINKFFNINNLFLECARLFFSGSIIYFLSEDRKFKNFFLPLSVILLFISFLGNFKIYLFCPSILIFFLSIENFINNKIIQKIFLNLGNLTYAIYLFHVPLQMLIILNLNIFYFSNDFLYSELFFMIYLLILILISNISYKYFEKPLNKSIRKKFY